MLSEHRFHAVIHLAAVSDYDVDHIVVDGTSIAVDTSTKLDTGDVMEIHLKRTPKLLAQLKELGGDRLVVVGFKLTNGASPDERQAAVLKVAGRADLVVHNDVQGMTGDRHEATIYRSAGDRIESIATVADNVALAIALEREVSAIVSSS